MIDVKIDEKLTTELMDLLKEIEKKIEDREGLKGAFFPAETLYISDKYRLGFLDACTAFICNSGDDSLDVVTKVFKSVKTALGIDEDRLIGIVPAKHVVEDGMVTIQELLRDDEPIKFSEIDCYFVDVYDLKSDDGHSYRIEYLPSGKRCAVLEK